MTRHSTATEGRITLLRTDGSTYTAHVEVVRTDVDAMDLRLPSGKTATVPLSAVRSFIPGSAADFAQAAETKPSPSTSSDGSGGAPPIPAPTRVVHHPTLQPRTLSLSEALKAVEGCSQALHAATQHPTPAENKSPHSINGELQSLRLALEGLHSVVSNKGYLKALNAIRNTVDAAVERTATDSLSEAKHRRNQYESRRMKARRDVDVFQGPSSVVEALRRCLGAVSTAELHDWQRFTSRFEARPRLIVRDDLTVNLSPSGEFLVPLKIALDDGPEPARHVKLSLDQRRGIEVVGNTPQIDEMLPGATKTIRLRLQDRRRQGARDDVKIEAHLQYMGPNDELLKSPRQKIAVRLVRPASFEPIPNPFRDYASGAPIDDPSMFFGRTKIIDDIVEHLTKRPVGRCYALYGQKRSGKSSIVNQLEERLSASGALVARLSMGVVDLRDITQTFVTEVVDQLREQVAGRLDEKTFANLLTRWPEPSAIAIQPLASLRKAVTAARGLLRSAGHVDAPRVVIMVDEFTYLFELLRRTGVTEAEHNQLRDFMRQWKGLLEAKVFSSLVVGQDTMPYFIRRFPNEFSVMHTERLDYLSETETAELADIPIKRDDGSSRFSGYGLQTIHAYTDGHPFYTQILCDRVVELANTNQRVDISDVDVDSAVSTLLSGSREIGLFRFDCLLSADNTGGLLEEMLTDAGLNDSSSASDRATRLAHRIALMGGEQNKPVEVDALALSNDEKIVFNDLTERGVVAFKDGKAHLRILLFAEYLRRLGR